jgi:hypothetical protein
MKWGWVKTLVHPERKNVPSGNQTWLAGKSPIKFDVFPNKNINL